MYVFNAWQDFEFYNVLFSIYTACAIVVITMYLLHKKKELIHGKRPITIISIYVGC